MIVGIIPARIGSKRFPKKILADIDGKPMVVHVAERAKQSKLLEKVILAIDSNEAKQVLSDFDLEIVMTSKDHVSGTDRVTEVVKGLDSAELIINIQGDEPLLEPKVIDGLIKIFDDSTVSMGTVVSRKIGIRDYLDRNVVKAFLDENQNAYDFKRDIYDSDIGGVFRHIGFYGFDRDTLLQFSSLPASKNEIKYSLEQFRALDNGIKIKAFISNAQQQAIDSPEDLDRVLSQLNKIKDTD
ncbi:3-deoxy-manno-octulosonate cytidylyltransferase [bacterium]|nr:MAG: 3-deoxy-manno-octulosonate cytidylyltransferase [bacterium]|tara:strand:+ start:80987 stop:81709 length:723 start_codon:yes stop_codon:yes gene_type:complete